MKRLYYDFWRTISTKRLKTIIKKSKSLRDVFRKCNKSISGASYDNLKKRLIKDNISVAHFHKNTALDYRKRFLREVSLDFIFKENSKYDSSFVRLKVLKNNLLKYECQNCPLKNEWNGKPLTLQLDHIDGDNTNNKLDNLRFLCPNCHTQTDTFGSRNLKNKKSLIICKTCKKEKRFKSSSGDCMKCHHKKYNPKKFEIKKDALEKLVYKMSIEDIGRKFKVNGNSIRKRCLLLGVKIPKFPNGYWLKKRGR